MNITQPKVSVIVATYNSTANLSQTLESIKTQNYPNIECIIVDGASTDSTLSVIENYEKKFSGRMKWISERDKGIYDAANKGLLMATGDIIVCFWDVFAKNDVISRVVKKMMTEHSDGAHGDLLFVKDKKVMRYWKMGEGTIQSGWMPAHPTLYLKKEVYEKFGNYNTYYRCSGDYEFMIRCLKNKEIKLSYIPDILVYMFYGGMSTNGIRGYWISVKEGHEALRCNGVKFPVIVDMLRNLRVMGQFITVKIHKQTVKNRKGNGEERIMKLNNTFAFLSQSYDDSWNDYEYSIKNEKTAHWDWVVITAADKKQAHTYQLQIEKRKRYNSLPSSTHYAIVSDPEGESVGSGGASLNAIKYIQEHTGNTEQIDSLKIAILHSSGDSKRVPLYSACGKLFSPVPRISEIHFIIL